MSIQQEINSIVSELRIIGDDMAKYDYIIEMGKALKPLDPKYKTDSYRVTGCQSDVWLHLYLVDDKLHIDADADALIVRGLVELLCRIYGGRTLQEILETDPEILRALELNEIISAGRQNGVASMTKKIYSFANEKITMSNASDTPSQSR